MPRKPPADRERRPTQGVPQAWTPLAEPFPAPNGLTVECLSSVEEMFALGDRFEDPLASREVAELYAEHVVMGVLHFYRVVGPAGVVSFGELKARDGKLAIYRDRSLRGAEGTPETRAALAAFAEAVNSGAVETAYGLDHQAFNPRPEQAGPRP